MSRKTSFDELYRVIRALASLSTGRRAWNSQKMQGQPNGTYATVYMTTAAGLLHDQVELTDSGDDFTQTPWNTRYIDVKVEFRRSADNDTALEAATRFINSMRLENRFYDIWQVCALVGSPQIVDVSSMFRADIEPRTEVNFTICANVADPAPLPASDVLLGTIETQEINLIHVAPAQTEVTGTEINLTITAPVEGD